MSFTLTFDLITHVRNCRTKARCGQILMYGSFWSFMFSISTNLFFLFLVAGPGTVGET